MDYIIFDLEWNQNPNGKKGHQDPLPFEILEIGAVKLDAHKQLVDTFHTHIRPQVYHKLHFQIQKMLGKTIDDYKDGLPFPEAADAFFTWCGTDYRFCTWGPMDLPELQRNLQYYDLHMKLEYPLLYYDVQKLFGITYETRKLKRTLEYAVDFLSLEKEEEFHEALCDAKYTARILQTLETQIIRHNYSIDCFRPPRTRQEEIYAVYDTYSKYISRRFETRDQAMADKEVTSTRCYLCGKPARKKIRWFSTSTRTYLCQCYCEHHGYLKGKIHLKPVEDGSIYAVKILKLISPEDAALIKEKQEEIRRKRRSKRRQKRAPQSSNYVQEKP